MQLQNVQQTQTENAKVYCFITSKTFDNLKVRETEYVYRVGFQLKDGTGSAAFASDIVIVHAKLITRVPSTVSTSKLLEIFIACQ